MKDTLNIRLQPETDNKNWKENCKTIQKMAQKTDLYKRFNIGQNWYEKTEKLYEIQYKRLTSKTDGDSPIK